LETSEFKSKTFFAMIDVIKNETAPDHEQEQNEEEIHV